MERDWEKELESAHALARSAIRVGETLLDLLAETRPYVAAANTGAGPVDGLLERIDRAIGAKRIAA